MVNRRLNTGANHRQSTCNWSANSQAWSKAGVTAKCNNYSDPQKTQCLNLVTQVFGSDSTPSELMNVTGLSNVNLNAMTAYKGWYMDLSQTAAPYEQVVTRPLTFGGVTYFSTFQAKSTTNAVCGSLGTSRGYAVDFQTGSLEFTPTVFLGGGLPPSPTGGLVQIDPGSIAPGYSGGNGGSVTVPFLVGVGGAPATTGGTGTHGNNNNQCKVSAAIDACRPTLHIKSTRKQVYRYPRIDKQD